MHAAQGVFVLVYYTKPVNAHSTHVSNRGRRSTAGQRSINFFQFGSLYSTSLAIIQWYEAALAWPLVSLPYCDYYFDMW